LLQIDNIQKVLGQINFKLKRLTANFMAHSISNFYKATIYENFIKFSLGGFDKKIVTLQLK